MPETHKRTLVKTLSWRLSASIITFILSYIFTGSLVISGSIVSSEVIVKTAWYYIHERIWNIIKLGTD